MRFVSVTACPTGIAHSQMAAEALETAAADGSHEVIVEVQGGMGVENELSADAVAAADAAIIAADIHVDASRFEDAGLPVVNVPVGDAIADADGLLADAVAAANGERPAEPTEEAKPTLVDRLRGWFA